MNGGQNRAEKYKETSTKDRLIATHYCPLSMEQKNFLGSKKCTSENNLHS